MQFRGFAAYIIEYGELRVATKCRVLQGVSSAFMVFLRVGFIARSGQSVDVPDVSLAVRSAASARAAYWRRRHDRCLLQYQPGAVCGAAIEALISSAITSGRSHWGQWDACSIKCSSEFSNRLLMCCATSGLRLGSLLPNITDTGTAVVCSLPDAIMASCRSRARGISAVQARISANASGGLVSPKN